MKIQMKLLLLLTLGLTAACSQPSAEDQQRIDAIDVKMADDGQAIVTIFETIALQSPQVARLVQGAVANTNTPAEMAELAAILVTGPDDIRLAAEEAARLSSSLWKDQQEKNSIREKTGGGWWEEIGVAAGGVGLWLLGMGMPTSGPLAPLFPWLAPWLEKWNLRNPEKRATARGVYAGPGDTVP